MTMGRYAAIGAAVLLASTIGAQAQPGPYPPYAYYPPYPYYHAPASPPSWSYDPYTSGLGACPNWTPGDSPCRERMQPTFGQPNYRPVR
jgi:hypothetical protein